METTPNTWHRQNPVKESLVVRSRYIRVSACQELDWMGNKTHYICRLLQGELLESSSSKLVWLWRHSKRRKTQGPNCRIKADKNLPRNSFSRIQHWGPNAWTLCNKRRTHKRNLPELINNIKPCEIAWRDVPSPGFTRGSLATHCFG